MGKDKQTDFESSLKALESIVERLEDENINLEDSVKSFEEGINLVKECQKQLLLTFFNKINAFFK